MISTFLNKLSPVNPEQAKNWKYSRLVLLDKVKTLFWYPASGLDLQAPLSFQPDACQKNGLPAVDLFFYSDYMESRRLKEICEGIEAEVLERKNQHFHYKKGDVEITLEDIIPLRYFSEPELEAAIEAQTQTHPKSAHGHGPMIDPDHQFYYCEFNIDVGMFGVAEFPMIFSPGETWFLKDQIFAKDGLQFDYICGVCDGCGKGGAYQCMNTRAGEFAPVMKDPGYWVTDHLQWKDEPDPTTLRLQHTPPIHTIAGWGDYSGEAKSAKVYPYPHDAKAS